MISLIVLRPQRFEAKPVGDERGWRIEACGYERIRGHDWHRTGLARPGALEFFSAAARPDAGDPARPGTRSEARATSSSAGVLV
ncbi:MAG TPA: hypothetical protein VFG98_06770 [Intrasporangium sp.]|nr:hypothetical protein [Intrasporangium sp.]